MLLSEYRPSSFAGSGPGGGWRRRLWPFLAHWSLPLLGAFALAVPSACSGLSHSCLFLTMFTLADKVTVPYETPFASDTCIFTCLCD